MQYYLHIHQGLYQESVPLDPQVVMVIATMVYAPVDQEDQQNDHIRSLHALCPSLLLYSLQNEGYQDY